jgi:GntR family transcriptional regulator
MPAGDLLDFYKRYRNGPERQSQARVGSADLQPEGARLPLPIAGDLPPSHLVQSVPLYEQVKRHLSEAILMGEWAPGTVLPNETDLARRFGVAVGTARRALSELTAEGLISRRRRTGTVVTGRTPHHNLRLFFQYFRLHGLDGALLRSTVTPLRVERQAAAPEERKRLAFADAAAPSAAPSADVVRVFRLRSVAGQPVMVDRMILRGDRVPDFPLDAVPELLYRFLVERYGIRISAVRECLSAELATAEDCRLLGLEEPAAVLVIDEVAYDQNGAAMIWATHRALTDRYRYVNEVS